MMNCFKKLMSLILADLLKKTDYNTKIKDIEDKIPNLATTTCLNAKINDVKGEMLSITGYYYCS